MGRQKLISGHIRKHKQSGLLYVVLSLPKPEGGTEAKWISTGLKDQRGNKKKADEILQNLRREYTEKLEKAIKPGNEMLFGDFMIFWLSTVKGDLKQTTYNGYYSNIHKVIAPYFNDENITLAELTAEHIEEFYSEQLLRVKPNTVLRYHANIHKALRFAAKKRDKPWYKPFIMEEVEPPSPNDFEAKFLNEDKVVELAQAVKGREMELPVLLGAYYGLRRGEVLGLRWSCIDFENNAILINHSVCELTIKGKRQFVFQTPKSKASIRSLPLDAISKDILLQKMQEQKEYRDMFGKSYNKAYLDYVLVNPMGELMRPDKISKKFSDLAERLGHGRMRFHDLRHTCASIMIARGVSMKQVQEWLGHSDYQLTANRYSHLEFQSKIQAAETVTWIQRLGPAPISNHAVSV